MFCLVNGDFVVFAALCFQSMDLQIGAEMKPELFGKPAVAGVRNCASNEIIGGPQCLNWIVGVAFGSSAQDEAKPLLKLMHHLGWRM